jgi:uncharacterized repeat protein (TIGR02543 family)
VKKFWFLSAVVLLLIFSMALPGPAWAQAPPSSGAWTQMGGASGLTEYETYGNGLVSIGGILYTGTYDGVWAWDGSTWSQVGGTSGLTGDAAYVNCLTDVNGTVYAGTDGSGVWAWDGFAWSQVGGASGLPGDAVAVYGLVDANGLVYAGTLSGLWSWNGTVWTQAGGASGPGDAATFYSLTVAGGKVYAGAYNSGVWAWDGSAWTQLGGPSGLTGNAAIIMSLACSGGTVYAGAFGGLWAWNGFSWSQVGGTSGLPEAAVAVMSLACSNGTVYAGTFGDGVWAWNGSAWMQVGGASGLTGAATTAMSLACSNGTLYAGTFGDGVWTAGTQPCALTYDGNGATGGAPPVDSGGPYLPGTTATVLGNTGNLVKLGYTFGGWNTAPDSSGTSYQTGDTLMITAGATLYAVWQAAPPCTVTYDGNGYTGGAPPVDANNPYLSDATVTVLGNTGAMTRTGYTFGGWTTAPGGGGTGYQAGDTFTITADATLYAVWNINQGTIPISAAYTNFLSGQSQLQINDDASVLPNGALQLIPSEIMSTGTVFYKQKFATNGFKFSTFFEFQFSNFAGINNSPTGGTNSAQTWGADGITFCIQPNSNNIGANGGGFGYETVPNSMAVEFDTFYNPPNNDPNDNHIAVDLDGDVYHGDATNGAEVNGQNIRIDLNQMTPVGFDMKDGNPHYVWIDYDGAYLYVLMSNTDVRADAELVLKDPIDLSNYINSSDVYVGFTGAAGDAWEEEDILQWDWANTYAPIDVSQNTYVPASGNDNVINLAISSGTLTPQFNQSTPAYTDSVPYSVSSVTVTTTASDPAAIITVNGTPAQSGQPSSPLSLNVGPNLITDVVAAQNGASQATYTITVTRAGPAPPAPPAIVPHGGSITPTGTAGITADLSGSQAIYYTITGGDSGTTPTVDSSVYSEPFIVSQAPGTFTVEAMVFDPDSDLWSTPDAATFIVGAPPATPTITPGDGSIAPTQTVSIEANLSGSQAIYYGIIDDTTMAGTSGNLYSGPFTVSQTPGTYSVIAWVYDPTTELSSKPDAVTYNVGAPAPPTIVQHGGSITTIQTAGITADLSAGQTVNYAIVNDTTQAVNAYVYSGPFIVSPTPGAFTVEASVYDPGTGQWSNPDVAKFAVSAAPPPPSPPTIVPHGGIITPAQTAGITADLSGSQTIYYTIAEGEAGTTPTVDSSVYARPLIVSPTPGTYSVEAMVYDPNTGEWSAPDLATFYVVGYGLTVTPPEIDLAVGQQGEAIATFATSVSGSVYATADVTDLAAWSSSDDGIATVDAGQIRGVAPGTTVVSAVYQGMTGAVSVTVLAPAPAYTVTYNGNGNSGGSVRVDSNDYQAGATVTALANTGNLVRTGYSFGGWNTAAGGSGATYQANGTFVMGTGDVILYAVWTPIISGGGGSGGGHAAATTAAPQMPPPPVPPPPASPSAFIARWPGHVDLDQTYYIPDPASGQQVPATFTAPAPDPGKLAAAKAQGLEERVYYFNQQYQKWVALASYPQPDGSVLVVNDGGYHGVWTEIFAVREPQFIDAAGYWAEDVINRMNGLALIEGYPIPGAPDPGERLAGGDRNITRAEFVTILARALGCLPTDEQKLYGVLLPEGQQSDQVLAGWTGVPDWAKDFVAGMVYSGIVQGEAAHDFDGNAPITRIEAAVLVSKVLDRLPDYQPADLSQFADSADVPDWAKAAVASGVLNGYPNGALLPNKAITRAEALVTVLKLLQGLGW